MNSRKMAPRLIGAFLSIALALPTPAFALRQSSPEEGDPNVLAGLEEALKAGPDAATQEVNRLAQGFIQRLAPSPAAGLEESPKDFSREWSEFMEWARKGFQQFHGEAFEEELLGSETLVDPEEAWKGRDEELVDSLAHLQSYGDLYHFLNHRLPLVQAKIEAGEFPEAEDQIHLAGSWLEDQQNAVQQASAQTQALEQLELVLRVPAGQVPAYREWLQALKTKLGDWAVRIRSAYAFDPEEKDPMVVAKGMAGFTAYAQRQFKRFHAEAGDSPKIRELRAVVHEHLPAILDSIRGGDFQNVKVLVDTAVQSAERRQEQVDDSVIKFGLSPPERIEADLMVPADESIHYLIWIARMGGELRILGSWLGRFSPAGLEEVRTPPNRGLSGRLQEPLLSWAAAFLLGFSALPAILDSSAAGPKPDSKPAAGKQPKLSEAEAAYQKAIKTADYLKKIGLLKDLKTVDAMEDLWRLQEPMDPRAAFQTYKGWMAAKGVVVEANYTDEDLYQLSGFLGSQGSYDEAVKLLRWHLENNAVLKSSPSRKEEVAKRLSEVHAALGDYGKVLDSKKDLWSLPLPVLSDVKAALDERKIPYPPLRQYLPSPDMAHLQLNPKSPVYLYVNPRALEDLPLETRQKVATSPFYKAVAKRDSAFFQEMIEDTSAGLLYVSGKRFGLELKGVSFEAPESLRKKIEFPIDLVTAPKIQDQAGKAFVVLIGYPTSGGTHYNGRGILFIRDFQGSLLEEKLRLARLVLRGLGSEPLPLRLQKRGHLFREEEAGTNLENSFGEKGLYLGISPALQLKTGWPAMKWVPLIKSDRIRDNLPAPKAPPDKEKGPAAGLEEGFSRNAISDLRWEGQIIKYLRNLSEEREINPVPQIIEWHRHGSAWRGSLLPGQRKEIVHWVVIFAEKGNVGPKRREDLLRTFEELASDAKEWMFTRTWAVRGMAAVASTAEEWGRVRKTTEELWQELEMWSNPAHPHRRTLGFQDLVRTALSSKRPELKQWLDSPHVKAWLRTTEGRFFLDHLTRRVAPEPKEDPRLAEFTEELEQKMQQADLLSLPELIAWAASFGRNEADLRRAIRELGTRPPEKGSFLEVLSNHGWPTGQAKRYQAIHRDGDWHAVVFVLLLTPRGEWILQRRSGNRLLDFSAGRHVEIDQYPLEAAVAGLKEELGVTLHPSRLIRVGNPAGAASRGLFRKVGRKDHAGPAVYDEEGIYRYQSKEAFNAEFDLLYVGRLNEEEMQAWTQSGSIGKEGVLDVVVEPPEPLLQHFDWDPEQFASGFKQFLSDPQIRKQVLNRAASVYAGLEERKVSVNVNLWGSKRIKAFMDGIVPLKSLSDPLRLRFAQEVVRQRPFGGYENKKDFLKRVRKGVTALSVSEPMLQAFADAASFGISRRTALGVTVGGIAALTGGGIVAKQLLTSPEGQLIWVFNDHEGPEDYEEVVRRLREIPAGRPAILVLENGMPRLRDLEILHPEVALQLTAQNLDELIVRVRREGDRGIQGTRLGAQLAELWTRYRRNVEQAVARFRREPGILNTEEGRRSAGATLPLHQYLATENREVQVLSDEPTLLSFLYLLRSNIAEREMAAARYRERNEPLSHQAFAGLYRFQKRFDQERDRALEEEFLPPLLEKNTGATVVVQRGKLHFPLAGRVREYEGRFRFRSNDVDAPDLSGLLMEELDPFRQELLGNDQLPIPAQAHPVAKRFFPLINLMRFLAGERRLRLFTATRVARRIIDSLSPAELDELTRALESANGLFDQAAQHLPPQHRYDRWLYWFGRYVAAWLAERRKLNWHMTTRQVEEAIREEIRGQGGGGRGAAGLEERVVVRTMAELQESALAILRFISRPKADLTWLLLNPDSARAVLARILDRLEKGEEKDFSRAQDLIFDWAQKFLLDRDDGFAGKTIEAITWRKLPHPMLRHLIYLIDSGMAVVRDPDAFGETPSAMGNLMRDHEYGRIFGSEGAPSAAEVEAAVLEKLMEDLPQRSELQKLEADLKDAKEEFRRLEAPKEKRKAISYRRETRELFDRIKSLEFKLRILPRIWDAVQNLRAQHEVGVLWSELSLDTKTHLSGLKQNQPTAWNALFDTLYASSPENPRQFVNAVASGRTVWDDSAGRWRSAAGLEEVDRLVQVYKLTRQMAEQAAKNGWTVKRLHDLEEMNHRFIEFFREKHGFTVEPKLLFKQADPRRRFVTFGTPEGPRIALDLSKLSHDDSQRDLNHWYLKEWVHALQRNLIGGTFGSSKLPSAAGQKEFLRILRDGAKAPDPQFSLPGFFMRRFLIGSVKKNDSIHPWDRQLGLQALEVHAAALGWALSFDWLPRPPSDHTHRWAAFWEAAIQGDEETLDALQKSDLLRTSDSGIPYLAASAAVLEAVLDRHKEKAFLSGDLEKRMRGLLERYDQTAQREALSNRQQYPRLKREYRSYFWASLKPFWSNFLGSLVNEKKDQQQVSAQVHGFIRRSQHRQALEVIEWALVKWPENPYFLLEKARLLVLTEKSQEALPILEQVLRVDPRNRSALTVYAKALSKLGRQQQAEHIIQELLSQDPKDLRVVTVAVHILHQAGKFKEAREIAAPVLQDVSHRSPQEMLQIAGLLHDLRKYPEALKIVDALSVVEVEPGVRMQALSLRRELLRDLEKKTVQQPPPDGGGIPDAPLKEDPPEFAHYHRMLVMLLRNSPAFPFVIEQDGEGFLKEIRIHAFQKEDGTVQPEWSLFPEVLEGLPREYRILGLDSEQGLWLVHLKSGKVTSVDTGGAPSVLFDPGPEVPPEEIDSAVRQVLQAIGLANGVSRIEHSPSREEILERSVTFELADGQGEIHFTVSNGHASVKGQVPSSVRWEEEWTFAGLEERALGARVRDQAGKTIREVLEGNEWEVEFEDLMTRDKPSGALKSARPPETHLVRGKQIGSNRWEWWVHLHLVEALVGAGEEMSPFRNGLLFRLLMGEGGQIIGLADPLVEPFPPREENAWPFVVLGRLGNRDLPPLIEDERLNRLVQSAVRAVQREQGRLRSAVQRNDPWFVLAYSEGHGIPTWRMVQVRTRDSHLQVPATFEMDSQPYRRLDVPEPALLPPGAGMEENSFPGVWVRSLFKELFSTRDRSERLKLFGRGVQALKGKPTEQGQLLSALVWSGGRREIIQLMEDAFVRQSAPGAKEAADGILRAVASSPDGSLALATLIADLPIDRDLPKHVVEAVTQMIPEPGKDWAREEAIRIFKGVARGITLNTIGIWESRATLSNPNPYVEIQDGYQRLQLNYPRWDDKILIALASLVAAEITAARTPGFDRIEEGIPLLGRIRSATHRAIPEIYPVFRKQLESKVEDSPNPLELYVRLTDWARAEMLYKRFHQLRDGEESEEAGRDLREEEAIRNRIARLKARWQRVLEGQEDPAQVRDLLARIRQELSRPLGVPLDEGRVSEWLDLLRTGQRDKLANEIAWYVGLHRAAVFPEEAATAPERILAILRPAAGLEEAMFEELADAARGPVRVAAGHGERIAVLLEPAAGGFASAAELEETARFLRSWSGYPFIEVKPLISEIVEEYRAQGYQVIQMKLYHQDAAADSNVVYLELPERSERLLPKKALPLVITDAVALWQRGQSSSVPVLLILPAAPYLGTEGILREDFLRSIFSDRYA